MKSLARKAKELGFQLVPMPEQAFLRKCREAPKRVQTGWFLSKTLQQVFWNTPPARPFVELMASQAPPNLGVEFKRSPANSFTPSRLRRFGTGTFLDGAATPPVPEGTPSLMHSLIQKEPCKG